MLLSFFPRGCKRRKLSALVAVRSCKPAGLKVAPRSRQRGSLHVAPVSKGAKRSEGLGQALLGRPSSSFSMSFVMKM